MFDQLISQTPYSLPQADKEGSLLQALNELALSHAARCPQYRRILDAMWGGIRDARTLADVPFLPVSIFKRRDLVSTADKTMVLTSSGTTGQRRSRIFVDAETSQRQSRALVATMKFVLGEKRLPLLVIDAGSVIRDPARISARGAGVLGMMKFGTKVTFALDDHLEPDKQCIDKFISENSNGPFLIFGFTFLVWTKLYAAFASGEIDLSNAILIHSGGWKLMEAQKVDNAEFRRRLAEKFTLTRIYNFYGMVEQIGAVYVEGEDGCLYPPNFADVIVRDERTWEPLGPGKPGVIQVLSALPLSYPGHSLLTEDIGEIVSIDSGIGGRLGKAFRVLGRLQRAELRGCSDVVAAKLG